MKTSHLKTVTCGLAALCLIAVGPATTLGQPVYAPIDLATNATAAAPAADTTATVTVTTNSVAIENNAAAAVPAAPAVAASAADTTVSTVTTEVAVTTTNMQPEAVVIPTIVMDEVPLTDAIKNLARQAGLNYI